jgi:PAS domain S-box-containing protein
MDELVDAAERYLIHFSLANDIIYSIDRDHILTSVSPSVERMLGYTPEELVGRPFYARGVIPEEYVEKAACELGRVLMGERLTQSTCKFITKDGQLRYGDVSCVPHVKGGRTVEAVSVAHDVTWRIEMERTLRVSEQRLRAVFGSARECIFMKDADLRYTFVNPCMEKALAMTSGEILGRTDRDVFGGKASELARSMDRRVLAGEEVEYELTWGVDGAEVVFHVVKAPVKDDASRITGLCGIARDVTERRRFEEGILAKERELACQALRLEEMNIAMKVLLDTREREKKDAVECMAEGLRRTVLPYLDRLEERLRDDSRVYLDAIRTNIEALFESNSGRLSRLSFRLTPMELRVADLVRLGRTTKEIASALNVSPHAVSFHRGNIRKKCGLLGEGRSLYTHLLSLAEED